ncbi:MAG TPA: hypothetical protein VE422_48480 [Terriglobia bacterium]|nr:hypothetical protein [Terriglobia bacterium]
MKKTVYCLASSEPQADAILTHLRNLGFTHHEVSVVMKKKEDTRDISMREDAIRGAEKGALVGGALSALATTVISLPILGPLAVAGPFLAGIGGAIAGGVVGGLAGGTGAMTSIGIPENEVPRLRERLEKGAILIAVHSDDPARLDTALRVFKSEGADEIISTEDLAA